MASSSGIEASSLGRHTPFVKLMGRMGRIAMANPKDLDLNLLRVFDSILRLRSVTAAGE